MKSNPNFSRVGTLAAALLAACFVAGPASAQTAIEGTFTLPFEVRWGRAVLPAGDYAFGLNSATLQGTLTIRQGQQGKCMVMSQGHSEGKPQEHSALFILRSGGKGIVRSLYLAEVGETFYYGVPKAGRQLVAQGPVLIQRIPVSVSGK